MTCGRRRGPPTIGRVEHRLALLTLGTAAAAAAVLAALRPRRVEVVGESMLPFLRPGDRLLLLRLPASPGAVVAVVDPREPARTLLKRVAAGPGEAADRPGGGRLEAGDGYVVLGDNPAASTDSLAFGAVPAPLLRGRAVYRYAPPDRRGAVSARPPPGTPMALSWPRRPCGPRRARRIEKGVR